MRMPAHLTEIALDGTTVVASADVGQFRLTPWTDDILHVAWHPTSSPAVLPMHGMLPADPDAPAPEVETNADGWMLRLPGLHVEITRDTARLDFARPDGTSLTALEMAGLTPIQLSGERTFHTYAGFTAAPDEAFYGLGQHQRDWMDHRNWDVSLAHDYKAPGGEVIGIPFLVTSRHYGIVWDNVSRGTVWPGGNGKVLWWSEVGEAVSFFVLAGGSADAVFAGYRRLTGATPLPPLAALGYIQCKQRYMNEQDVLDVAQTYREKNYPCDILVVDWFHWKTLGDIALDPRHWPDPAGMNEKLTAMGYHVMISCWPRFMRHSRHFDHLERNRWFMQDAEGYTVDGTPDDARGALIDTTHPDAARWYWDTIHASYGTRGFSSWWLDENEPDINPHAYYLHAGTGARVHNLYPLTHNRAIYEGHRRDRDDRCLILSRSAYHGAQATGATFWSSDIHPTWDVFRRQIPCGLNFCASGFAWWSSDIGGWHALPGQFDEGADFRSLLIETGDQPGDAAASFDYTELYVRWFQYGAFCPTFRAHGTRPENEVWSFGPDAEAILVKYLKLRYRLLPYLYALAWRTTQTGAPFMRALWMDFPADPSVRDLKYAYMLGPAFLVAPVYTPGASAREVYLPAGADWYDYWTDRWFAGGQTVCVNAPLETLPLFVRAGSIVPHGEVVPHTGIAQRDIEVRVYEGADATFQLYRDDGRTYAYEHGDYRLTTLAWDDAEKRLRIDGDTDGLFQRAQHTFLRRISS